MKRFIKERYQEIIIAIGMFIALTSIIYLLTQPKEVCATCTGVNSYGCGVPPCATIGQCQAAPCDVCCDWNPRTSSCITKFCSSVADVDCLTCGCSATTTTTTTVPTTTMHNCTDFNTTSGWINCTNMCNISGNIDALGADINVSGTAPFEQWLKINGTIFNYSSVTIKNCEVVCILGTGSGCFDGGKI